MTPSVTRVLSPWADFSAIRPDVLEHAAERGTAVHVAIATYCQGLWVPALAAERQGYFDSFRRWFDRYVRDVGNVEQDLTDTEYGFHGHPDAYLRINGSDDGCLIDWKTPATVSLSWRPQTAAYRHLTGADRNMAIRLKANGGMPIVDDFSSTYEQDFALFLNALAVWKFFNQDKKEA